jgi:hypothetical protein
MRLTVRLTVALFTLGFAGHVLADPIEWPVSEGGNGHAYDTVSSAQNWATASMAAASMTWHGVPGYLATITSEAEHEFVRDAVGPCPACWLGGIQEPGSAEPDGGWSWITGEAWGFTQWSENEPNNDGNEMFLMTVWWDGTHLWNDEEWPPFEIRGFIVEFDLTKVRSGQWSWGKVKSLYD